MITKTPRRQSGRSVEGQARQSHRVKVADAYLTGVSTVVELADIHQVSIYTIRDWIRDRRDTFMLDHRKKPLGTRRDRTHEPALVAGVYGTGGNMTDESVRQATRDLEKAIVALQKKLMLSTFTYRKEVTT
jgi:hypothetical protein